MIVKHIDLGITTRCNLKCPLCYRAKGEREIIDLPFEILEKISEIDTLEKLTVCGSLGDPVLYPHFDRMIDLFLDKFRDIIIVINTNGTMNSPEWWYEFGKKFSQIRGYIQFAIDGIETYSRYRVGSTFETVFDNVMGYISSGAMALWQFIIFDYNEYELERAENIANQLGMIFKPIMSYKYTKKFKKPKNYNKRKVDNLEIYCRSLQENSISIDIDGIVTPCCHLRPMKDFVFDNDIKLFIKYLKCRKDINFLENSLENIFNSEFFKYLYENYKETNICKRSCYYYRYKNPSTIYTWRPLNYANKKSEH